MNDPINNPEHYNTGKIEVIDFIDDQKLGFCEGNTVKYICRAKHKGNELEDLQKARWYLDHVIQKLEAEQEHIPFQDLGPMRERCECKQFVKERSDKTDADWFCECGHSKMVHTDDGCASCVTRPSPRDLQPYSGPFVGRRVTSPLEEWTGTVTKDDGDQIVVSRPGEPDFGYSLAMFKTGIKEKWLVWVKDEEKKDDEQKKEE